VSTILGIISEVFLVLASLAVVGLAAAFVLLVAGWVVRLAMEFYWRLRVSFRQLRDNADREQGLDRRHTTEELNRSSRRQGNGS
jgi:hypothetical protein